MGNSNVGINVTANTAGVNTVTQGVNQTNKAVQQAGKSVEQLNKQLKETLAIASKLAGVRLSESDLMHIHQSTQGTIRRSRNLAGSGQQDIFDLLSGGYTHLNLQNRQDAERRMRNLLVNSLPAGVVPHGGGAPHHPGGAGTPGAGIGFGLPQTMMGWGKGLMAMAGITGVMSMAGQANAAAKQEAFAADALHRMLGGSSNVDFERIKEDFRKFDRSLGIASSEAINLAKQFAQVSGETKGLGDEVKTGGGFGRSFGMDPSQSVGFFANMRKYMATGSGEDSRRLALQIGEAVAKHGLGPQTGMLLEAVQSLAQSAARSFSTANPTGYLDAITGLMGSKSPGMDMQGSLALLTQADSGVRSGGKMGEASKLFWLQAIRRQNPGMDPIMAQRLLEGGMFASTSSVFGTPAMRQYAGHTGMALPGMSSRSLFEMGMDQVHAISGNSPYRGQLMMEIISNAFGTNLGGGMALANLYHGNRNAYSASTGLAGRAGIDIGKLNETGVGQFSKLAVAASSADMLTVQKMVDDYLARSDVTDDEKKRLRGTADFTKLTEELARVVARTGEERTEAQKVREEDARWQNKMSEYGENILRTLTDIRGGVLDIADLFGGKGRATAEAHREQTNFDLTKQPSFDPVQVTPDRLKRLKELEAQYNLPPGMLKGIWGTESSFGKNLINKDSGAAGHMQWMPETAARYGVLRGNFDSEADGAARYLADLYKQRGSWKGALYGYNGVVKNTDKGDKYISDVMRNGDMSVLEVDPNAAARRQAELRHSLAVSGSATVNVNVNGQAAGVAEMPLSTHVGPPMASGFAGVSR